MTRPLTKQERAEVDHVMHRVRDASVTSVEVLVSALVRRRGDAEARLRWHEDNPGATHYAGCESEHRACALARLEEALVRAEKAERLATEWRDYAVTSDGQPPDPDHLLPWERPASSQEDAGDLPPEGYVRCNLCHATWPLGGGHVCSPAEAGAGA